MHVESSGDCQPAHDEPEPDQQAASDEFPALLESRRYLPAEKQHQTGAQGKQHRVSDGKPYCEAKRARVSRRTERRRERESGYRHEVIGAEAVKEPEREHGAGRHAGIIDGFRLQALGFGPGPQPGV
jgi:hypothetical protein